MGGMSHPSEPANVDVTLENGPGVEPTFDLAQLR
jgi:hypothetical protein